MSRFLLITGTDKGAAIPAVLIVTSRIAAGWGGCAAFATGILCFRFATGVVRFRFATGILLFGRAERVYGLSVYDGLGRRLIAQPLDVEKRTKGETPRLSVRRRAGQIEAVDMSQANLARHHGTNRKRGSSQSREDDS